MKLDVINLDGKKSGDIELDADLFGLAPRVSFHGNDCRRYL